MVMVVVGMAFVSTSHGYGSGWYGFCLLVMVVVGMVLFLLVMVMVVVGMVFVSTTTGRPV